MNNGQNFGYFGDFISYFHIYPIFSDIPKSIFYISFSGCVIYFFTLYLFFGITYYYLKQNINSQACVTGLYYLLYMTLGFFLIPTIGTFGPIIFCNDKYLRIQSEVQCWSYGHIIIFIISVFLLVLFGITGIICEILFIENIPSVTNYDSHEFSMIFIIENIIKIILTLLLALKEELKWEIIVVIIIGYGYIIYEMIRQETVFYLNIANKVIF